MAIACTAHFKKKVAKGVGIYVTRGGRPAVVEKRETQGFRIQRLRSLRLFKYQHILINTTQRL